MDIKIEHTFNSPVQKVWEYWSNAEQFKKWWGPKDWTAPVIEIDFRVGGKFLGCMRGAMEPGQPEQDFWSGGEYQEIIPLQKIVTTDYFTNPDGQKVNGSEIGMPGEWPDEMLVTVTFEDLGGSTKINLLYENHPADLAHMAKMGWEQSFDKLYALLA